MRIASAAFLWLALAGAGWGQEAVPLIIDGKFDIVKVTRYIPLIEERQVFKEFPFTIKCPNPKAFRPAFVLPPGFVGTQKGVSFVVTSAPKGEHKIDANWGIVDFKADAVREEFGSLTIIVGDIGPGPTPPVPPPPPVTDPLIDAAKFAFQMEFSPTKSQEAAGFAAAYSVGIASKATTWGKLYEEIGAAVKARNLSGKLPNVQKVVNAELSKTLPNPTTQPNLAIDEPSRALIARQFARVVAAWEALQ